MGLTNFPVQLTSFIGRDGDLAAVEQMLSTSRLVTLTGVGGCGKTRLAIQVANTVQEKYASGVWLIDLVPLRDAALIPQLVVQTLGLRLAADEPPMEKLLRFVGSKQLLLIFDNCEHLSEAIAELVRGLLSYAPGLCILATSREVLGIAGEVIYPVSGLACPSMGQEVVAAGQNHANLHELMGYDSVHLFVDRAKACAPNFRLTPENAPATVEICCRLDGLPLALELASARINVLTVQEIADRLYDRFALLTAGPRSGYDPRHQTLRAAIDWSYTLLSADEQIMFRHLAVFEAGFTLDTAQSVCTDGNAATEPILEEISSLVSKSLVVADTVDRAQARYRLLETIREYALEKLEEVGETAALRDRHLDFFLARAEEAEPKLNDAYQQLWLNWLEGEHDNLRASLAWALDCQSIEKGLRMASAIVRFWEIRGYWREGLAWFERLLHQADDTVSPIVRANALSRAAFLAMFLGDAPTTAIYGQEAVVFAEGAGEEGKVVLTIALGALASGARMTGNFLTAFTIQERMIRLLREMPGQSFILDMTLMTQGSIAIELGYYDTARTYLVESLSLAQEAGDSFRTAYVLNSMGDLARCEQKYTEALTAYERCAALFREVGAQQALASALLNLGHACLHLGNVERAHILFRESMTIQQKLQNLPGISECLTGFAAIAIIREMPAVGARLLGASAAIGGKRVAVASVWYATRMEYEHYLELAQTRLYEADFLAEQAAGHAMSLDQAIDYAMSLPLEPKTALASEETPDGLTGRECEIAALIGQGMTNGEIAVELVLSKRTVESHVSKILSKLGLKNRAQIMLWAIEHGLTKTPE
jgi:predicted ATPase/DNA-binding CsgD family transcriptional regulator